MVDNRDPERVPEPDASITLTEADLESLEIALSKDNQNMYESEPDGLDDLEGRHSIFNEESSQEENFQSIYSNSSIPPPSKRGSNRDAEVNTNILYDQDSWPPYCDPFYRMPGCIEVRVMVGDNEYDFPVNIIRALSDSKKYMGGFRNKMTGSVFHHAASQTPVAMKEVKDTSSMRTRETQTCQTRTLSVQSYREAGTQMERVDLTLDNRRDRNVQSRPYTTSYDVDVLKKRKCIEIQRYWRGYVARSMATRLRHANIDQAANDKLTRLKLIEEQTQKKAALSKRKKDPKTNEDFAVLYNELEAWRIIEVAKIKSAPYTSEERTAAMSAMLDTETRALQNIQKLKHAAQKDISSQHTQHMLEMMSEPQQWQLSSGSVAQVQTPSTIRAKELLELYRALSKPLTSVDDTDARLEILLQVKWTVKEFDDPLTRDIADLVDREGDLLNRGRPLRSMERLRQRLNGLLLQFLDNPQYNPRAADFIQKNM